MAIPKQMAKFYYRLRKLIRDCQQSWVVFLRQIIGKTQAPVAEPPQHADLKQFCVACFAQQHSKSVEEVFVKDFSTDLRVEN